MAALVTWKVKLFVVNTDPTAKTKADHADTIGVSAKAGDHDGARAAAKAWLSEREYRVRSINFTKTGEMIAYVVKLAPGEKKAVTPLVQRPAVKPAASTRARVPSHPHPPVRRSPAPALPPPTPGPRKPTHA